MPLVEYSEDLDLVFDDIVLPSLKKYEDAEDLAKYYLANDSRRERIVGNLREYADSKYAPKKIIKEILEQIFPVS